MIVQGQVVKAFNEFCLNAGDATGTHVHLANFAQVLRCAHLAFATMSNNFDLVGSADRKLELHFRFSGSVSVYQNHPSPSNFAHVKSLGPTRTYLERLLRFSGLRMLSLSQILWIRQTD